MKTTRRGLFSMLAGLFGAAFGLKWATRKSPRKVGSHVYAYRGILPKGLNPWAYDPISNIQWSGPYDPPDGWIPPPVDPITLGYIKKGALVVFPIPFKPRRY